MSTSTQQPNRPATHRQLDFRGHGAGGIADEDRGPALPESHVTEFRKIRASPDPYRFYRRLGFAQDHEGSRLHP